MPTKSTAAPTHSGIATTSTGDRHIPSSIRADGTVRKEIRVRPGYRPPEDVEVYKNKTAEHFKARGIPGAEYADGTSRAKPKVQGKADAVKKPAKEKKVDVENGVKEKEKEKTEEKEAESIDPEVEKEKEAKKLAKKLRQARELAQKKEEGAALLPEQFQKVIKISELIRQLEKLGYDQEGVKKV